MRQYEPAILIVAEQSPVDLTSREGRRWLGTVIDTFKSIVTELDISHIDTNDIEPQSIDEAIPLIDLRFKKRLLKMLDDSPSIKINAKKLDFSNTYRGSGEKSYLVFDRPDSLEHFVEIMRKLRLQFTNARFFLRQGEQFLPVLHKIKQPAIELTSELVQKLLYRDEQSVCAFRLEGKTTEGPQGMQDIVNYLLFWEYLHIESSAME